MAIGFNTQVGNGEYRLQFETDNKEYYLLMDETARRCVDGKPVTNADRIRSMTDDELNELFHEIYNAGADDASSYEWGQRTNSFEWTMDWLQQPAEEDDHA